MTTNFVARQKGSFTALIQSTSLGPYDLEARPPVTLRDRYFDTDDGELLRRGMRLLVRDAGGELTTYLIGNEDAESSPKWVGSLLQESLEPDRRVLTSAFELPRGDLQDTLLEYIEGDHVMPLLELRQHQARRVVREDDREVATLSFDVVVFEDPVEPVISNEAILEVSDSGTTEDIKAIAGIFREVGLEPEERSKFGRGVLRKARTMDESILLLPSEQEELEEIASMGAEMEQKSARVILLDSRGFRDMTISDETGFKTPTVRRLRHAFRQSRMGVFDYLLEEEAPATDEETQSDVEVTGDKRGMLEGESTDRQDDLAIVGKEESYQDIDSFLQAFQPVDTQTPRFRETEEDEDEHEKVEAEKDVGRDHQTSVCNESAERLQAELDRLDRYALAARSSIHNENAVGGILYTAHRILVLLDWFDPLVPTRDREALVPTLEDAIHRADRVLDYVGAAASEGTRELLEARDQASAKFQDWLKGSNAAEWRGQASRLVLRLENQSRNGTPHPSAHEILLSALLDRHEKMGAIAAQVEDADFEPPELYRLATLASGFQLLLEAVETGDNTKAIQKDVSKAETVLARARHARVRASITGKRSFLDRGPNDNTIQAAIDSLRGTKLRRALIEVVGTK